MTRKGPEVRSLMGAMGLEIIYEDSDIAVVNKPAGVLFDWAIGSRPDFLVVHRLDKDTSGIILFAKNEKTADTLKGMFQKHEIKKTYRALVVGDIKKDHGVINLPIGRSAQTPLRRVAVGKQRGTLRESITEYKVLKRFGEYTYVEAYPKTGRTHQIRSHFAAINHPLVCDALYAGKRFVCPVGLTRHFLHAEAVEFTLPALPLGGSTGSRMRFEADMPEDLTCVLREL